jgi:superfamily II DNA or RNA helicase
VATIQTLARRFDSADCNWLRAVRAVVVDECHHAIAPTYTGMLRWLEAVDQKNSDVVLLGLTATPFRGTDDDDTRWLLTRFGKTILPEQSPSKLYGDLTERGFVAHVDTLLLDPHAGPIRLDQRADAYISMFHDLPPWVLERLAVIDGRNKAILDAVFDCSAEDRILLFACSVAHAKHIARAVNLRSIREGRGIRAASITAETRKGARQWFVREFSQGAIRVLTNFNTLSTGFDAPRTTVVIVARPTSSPVLYQQMVGRGLRGPRNGGAARCRVITVNDNIVRFDGRHVFDFHVRLLAGWK